MKLWCIGLVVIGLGGCEPIGEFSDETLEEAAGVLARNTDGTVAYVDTHDNYAHTSKIDPAKFLYFTQKGGKPAVALTFDCAWVEQANATDLLDALARNGIKSTFFLSGPFLFVDYKKGLSGGLKSSSLPILKRLIDDGHEFGNHTQTHPHYSASTNELTNLAAGFAAAVKTLYPSSAPANATLRRYWRAPYGEYTDATLRTAASAGYPYHFGWNVDVLDASGRPACTSAGQTGCVSPKTMTDLVLKFEERNRSAISAFVVLAHLSNPYWWGSRSDGLDNLAAELKARGYVFAKLSEIFAYEAAVPPPGTTCIHTTGGGIYGDGACTASYQCCAGVWTRGINVCGTCQCSEPTGKIGCSAAPAPVYAPCTHSYGGVYRHAACSASYQCCDGSWTATKGQCGACVCTETSGKTGC